MTEQNRFDPIDEQPTEINCQRELEKFSESVLLFILEVLKVRDAKKVKLRVPLPQ